MDLSIDVVVTAFGRYDLTRSCLSHLQRQTVRHNVIVVINGSVEDEAGSVRRDFPACWVVELESNRGFAEATNLGVAAGEGEIVVLLNNDVDCDPTFLEEIVRPLEEDPTVGSSSSLLLRPGRILVDSMGLVADPTLACFPRHQGLAASDAASCQLAVTGPAGAGAAYRRTAWEQVGGLDEHLLAYMEDFDIALQLRAAGWASQLAPAAVAVHLGSATFGSSPSRQRENGGFGRGYVLRRYGVMCRIIAARAILTEAIVVVADALTNRDLAALKGRLAGWRAANGLAKKALPPPQSVDIGIGFLESLRKRRRA